MNRIVLFLISLVFLYNCSTTKSGITIPANQTFLLGELNDENYSVEWRMINAADYGFPQKRRRVFIFACKNSTKFGKYMNKDQGEEWISKRGFFAKDFPVKVLSFDGGKQNDLFAFSSQSIKEVSDTYSIPFSKSGFMTKEGIFNFSASLISCLYFFPL